MNSRSTYVLGLHTSHDASACLLKDGKVICAVEKERLTRVKHDEGACGLQDIIAYCLDSELIDLDRVDHIVISDIGNIRRVPVVVDREVQIGHHLAHAWSAIGPSPFHEAAILIMDGEGSRVAQLAQSEQDVCVPPISDYSEKESCYTFRNGELTPIRKWCSSRGHGGPFSGTDSVGALYWFLSQLIFGEEHQESKIMGLASYGSPDPKYEHIITCGDNGEIHVDPEWTFSVAARIAPCDFERFGDEYIRLAASVQALLGRALLHKARFVRAVTGQKSLCYAGGVALNCVANAALHRANIFDSIYIPPGAGDSSLAIGCAYYGWHVLHGCSRRSSLETPYLGQQYTDEATAKAVSYYVDLGLVSSESRSSPDDHVIDSLISGKVVAWFHGRSEFGPRALGNRSLLADPRSPDVREQLNRKVKYREPFRPFAPSVIAEEAAEWFENIVPGTSYMQYIAYVRSDRRSLLPSITHVDGTARIHLVEKSVNPRFHALLQVMGNRTGIPILLNTSFNIQEPIVETPKDALKTYVASAIDVLVLEQNILRRRATLLTSVSEASYGSDLFLIWHEPVAITRTLGPFTWKMERVAGEYTLNMAGALHTVRRHPATSITPEFANFIGQWNLEPGDVVSVPELATAKEWSRHGTEVFSALIRTRVASLVRRRPTPSES